MAIRRVSGEQDTRKSKRNARADAARHRPEDPMTAQPTSYAK